MKRAAAYARYSSTQQQDISIEAQFSRIEEFAKRNNYIIVARYEDRAISGFSSRRPGLQQLLADAKLGKFETVIVWEFARLARDRTISRNYKEQFRKLGIELISVTEHIPDSPEGVIIESLYEGMAEYYSRKLARDSMRGLIQTVKDGYVHGGYPPFGLKFVKDEKGKSKYAIEENEAKAVRKMFEMAAKGETLLAIARWLNDNGYKPRRSQKFNVESVRDILKNPKYIGKIIFNKRRGKGKFNPFNEIIEVEAPEIAIIDEDLFIKVQQRLSKNKHKPARRNYILRGLVQCGICGHPLSGAIRQGNNAYYYCTYCWRNNNKKVSIGADKLENIVINFVKSHFEHLDTEELTCRINKKIKQKLNPAALKTFQQNLDEVNNAIKNITKAIEMGAFSNELLIRLNELEREKMKLEKDIRSALTQIKSLRELTTEEVEHLKQSVLKELTNRSTARELLINLIEHITVNFETTEILFTTKFGDYVVKYNK
ncbi:Recombinase [Thermosipho africanus H17ap60334]|uniref:recombinase family protein n=1 Tax=Thermosipho africanus TaxID=2421 RepID=UPI00028DCF45|nr:recombinase family protein [Thermosipho africanus]EKF49495.1 Recombinase [Thermosipho africanus H17ap60334]